MNRSACDEYVLAILKYGSFTTAAKHMKISQPAITQAVNSLEKELGFKIFNRKTNPVSTTGEGALYVEYVLSIRAMEKELMKKVECMKAQGETRVVAGAPSVYMDSVVSPAAAKLVTEHPDYSITLKTGSLEELEEMCRRGELDCFICTSDQLPEQEFSLIPVFKEEIAMCVPESWDLNEQLEEDGDTMHLKDQKFIFLDDSYPLQKQVNAYFAELGMKPEANIVVDQVATAIRLSELNAGICFASCNDALGRKVKAYSLALEGRDIFIAVGKNRYQTKACKDLISCIISSERV